MGPRDPEAGHERQRESVVFHKAGGQPVVAARHDEDLASADQVTEFVGRAGLCRRHAQFTLVAVSGTRAARSGRTRMLRQLMGRGGGVRQEAESGPCEQ